MENQKSDIVGIGDDEIMLEIYLVRHGRTLFNEKDRVQGWCDSPLTKTGVAQAKNVGKNMRHIPFTVALSSPSERASDTCEYVLEGRLPIILDKRLKEMNFGYLEGEMNAKLREGKPEDFVQMCEIGWVDEGGENTAMVLARVQDFFENLVEKYDNEVILITSHGMWINFAVQYLMDEDVKLPFENCSVSKFVYEKGQFRVEYLNNTSFRDVLKE